MSCAPVHDAILIEAPLEELDDAVAVAQGAMAEATKLVLDGHSLRSDAKVFRHPDRFQDARGQEMWNAVSGILSKLDFSSFSYSSSLYVPPQTPDTPDTPETPNLPVIPEVQQAVPVGSATEAC
jgi:hypothetical protein